MQHKTNSTLLLIKCLSSKYASDLMNTGSIKFNDAQTWVDAEKSFGKGRGDLLEGTYAACLRADHQLRSKFLSRYYDAYEEQIGNLIYFRRKRTMELPCYCLFAISKNDCVQYPEDVNSKRFKLPPKYFQDFAGNISKDEARSMISEKQPNAVVIPRIGEFIYRITNKLVEMGFSHDEIIICGIQYKNKKIPAYCSTESPIELLIKHYDFGYQKELRFIINTDKEELKRHLLEHPIQIGPIHDIAKCFDRYFFDGFDFYLTADHADQDNYQISLVDDH